jgi:hypothetical protein
MSRTLTIGLSNGTYAVEHSMDFGSSSWTGDKLEEVVELLEFKLGTLERGMEKPLPKHFGGRKLVRPSTKTA